MLRLTKKSPPLASEIQKAYPVGFRKWCSLAEELGTITEQIQDTHREKWEKMVTLLEEMIKVEAPVQMAQMQSAHARALERMEKKYDATLRILHTKYIKWKSLACTPQTGNSEDSDDGLDNEDSVSGSEDCGDNEGSAKGEGTQNNNITV